MATLMWASVKHFKSKEGWKVALALVFALGVSTELIQEFAVLTRQGSVMDLAADVAGALVVLAVLKQPLKAMIME